MRKIVNRQAVPVDADPAPASPQEGPKNPEDTLNVSELDVGADRQNSEVAVDYAKLGEHVASVVKAAEVAAEGIRAEAEKEVERLREGAEEQAATRLDEANREAERMRREADRLRAEAEEATKTIRREAEAEAAKVIEAAKQIDRREEYAAEDRRRTLQENVELTEKRLKQLVGGLREVAVQLEDLIETESSSARSDEGQITEPEETLDESLRASLGT
jgi:hypothetical protein